MPMTTMLFTETSNRLRARRLRLATFNCNLELSASFHRSTARICSTISCGAEIAFPAVEAAGAKFAAVGAADLRGNAERVAVAGLAVKRGIGGNQNTFDERAVGQLPEKFLRGVARALLADKFERLQRIIFRATVPAVFSAGWSSRPSSWRGGRKASRAVA